MRGIKKRVLFVGVWMIFSVLLLLMSGCEKAKVTPNAVFSSPLDGEILFTVNGEIYRITLHLSPENEGEKRKGELIYLSPRGMEGISVISDDSGRRIRLHGTESETENESLLLPFFLFQSGEIAGKDIGEDEIIYRYTDGRRVYYSVKTEQMTRILYRDAECKIEWLDVRRGQER
jgi:hypothetical protein